MKRTILAASAALLAIGSAQAQTMPPYSTANVYGELGYTWLKIDAAGTSSRPEAIRGILGYDAHPYGAIEFMLGGGVSDDNKNVNVPGGGTANVNVDLKEMYGIFVRPKYKYQQVEGFFRLGWAHTKVNAQSTNSSLNSTQSDDDFAWGLGLNFRFNPNMFVGIDWMRYSNQSGHKVDGMTLGFGYHW